MNKERKVSMCEEFYSKLCDLLKESHVNLGSCNKDISRYLVPIGTEDKVTYYGKPEKSFRISDHWSWYANVNKCINEKYIQCLNVDLPWAKPRVAEGKPSAPINAVQVAVVASDGKYHAVFGEVFDRETRTWDFITPDPEDVIGLIFKEGSNEN